jgi:hypothetical protein
MKEEIAFELMKLLKKDGHAVAMKDQPNMCVQAKTPDMDYYAIVGAKGMTPEGVKACSDVIRKTMHNHLAPYTIETEGNKIRFFPDASFAAW